jgi:signal transduction histidine kinase
VRRRLLFLVAATTSVVALAFIVPLAVLVDSDAHARGIIAATTLSHSVVPLVAAADDRAAAEAARAATRGGFSVLVTLPGGRTVGTPAERWRGGLPVPTIQSTAVRRLPDGGAVVDQPVFRSDGTAIVSVRASSSVLTAGVARARTVLVLLGVILVGLSMLASDRLARSLTRPVAELAAAANRLGRGELDAPLRPAGPPEIHAVGVALSALTGRITALLASERQAVADLSHQLRTPLTAVRLDAESLRDAEERARLSADVEHLIAGVDAVIAQARRPLRETRPASGVSDLAEVTAERVAFWRVLAEEQARTVTIDLPPGPCPVAAARDEVVAAVDALLDNVFAHTPEGSGFSVTVTPERTGGATLTVADEGLGFPDDATSGLGTNRPGSSGLGLDIAQRLARASGGAAHISSTSKGGQVQLRIGGPTPSASRATAAPADETEDQREMLTES